MENKPLPLKERLSLLERGLRLAPNSLALLGQLGAVLERRDAEADDVRTTLKSLVTDGKAGATTYAMLGIDAYIRGRSAEARAYWEQAFQIDPAASLVANNLAWVLAHEDSPDLDRALELADRALGKRPNDPFFHGTRGYILMKLRRWSEALVELKAKLAALPDRVDTHLDLAEVYDHLELPELATAHREAATKMGAPPVQAKSSPESTTSGVSGSTKPQQTAPQR